MELKIMSDLSIADLAKTIGKMEGKLDTKLESMCVHSKEQHQDIKDLSNKIDDKFDNLPCHINYKDLNDSLKQKASIKLMIAMGSLLFVLITGAYAYTTIVGEKFYNHSINHQQHFIIPNDINKE